MTYHYHLVGFSAPERPFIDNILQDQRGWAGKGYSFTLLSSRKNADVIVMKRTNRQIRDLFVDRPDLEGLSVANLAVTPTEIFINGRNWNNIPKDFMGSLDSYRAYLIQHEMGHALGYGHKQPHPDPQLPCPVMYQQTRGTKNRCQVNPWKTLE
jgi:hypothetical protein